MANAEWDAAVGTSIYPWGDYFPPKWDDGNYAFLENGKDDPKVVGVDGILGTAPVASFKPNALGFYDLGGNVWEWIWDGGDEKTRTRALRGCSWIINGGDGRSSAHSSSRSDTRVYNSGFRLVRKADR